MSFVLWIYTKDGFIFNNYMVLDVCVHLSQPLNVEESEDEFDIDEIKLFARHRYVVEKPITKYNWLNGESMT